ncbi:MAG: DUF3800 domain-containing protein [Rhizobiales bacterium]|nr:DUF3800 domain-containing protein [Hyphomicrobiales bacterium]
MSHSFVALIDESGDDGLGKFREPGQQGGQTSWLVISACVYRIKREREVVGWRDSILAKMPEKKGRVLHFEGLTHQQRIVAAQSVGQFPLRLMSVLSNKRTIEPGTYTQKNQLYFYLTRYLIERISWFCRDEKAGAGESGQVKIIFSRRGGMSYPDFREYLLRLRQDPTVKIHWPVIDIDGIRAEDHSTRAGLQIADIITSSIASGIEPDRFGNCETRYAESLRRVTYRRNKNYFSYGVKLVPKLADMPPLSAEQMRFIDLYK